MLFRQLRTFMFPEYLTDLLSVKTDANFVRRGFVPRDVLTGFVLAPIGPETEIRQTETGFQVRTFAPMNSFLFLTFLSLLMLVLSVLANATMIPLFLLIFTAYVVAYRLAAPIYHAKTVKAAQSGEPVTFDMPSALDVFRTY
ncbi:hypothetical protein [Ponticaulis profundi]|uniref:Uncharacterized protein n=1 Tax=Ponticaulis profundi TaxID=2665222 RepID=A0ABW1S8J2_9PROT